MMELDQCFGRYARLQEELAIALEQRPGNSGKIDRLADELVTTERSIADLCSIDEQCGERLFG
jgi:hypothetical protein